MKRVIIPQAQQDIEEIAAYYAKRKVGLDEEFLVAVEAAMAEITHNPLRFERVRPGIRRYLMDRFPYGIYFRMPDDNTVRIILVRHHSRRPGFGMRRH